MITDFFNHFDLVLATTPEQKRDVYHIRYQVYCDELGFEDKRQFKQPFERDGFDEHAHHFLIRHKRTGMAAGTARCVLPFDDFGHKKPLPSERFCQHALDQQQITSLGLRRGDYAEVSRIAIRAEFRRRITLDHQQYTDHQRFSFTQDELKSFSHIATALYFALASYYLLRDDIKTMIAMMEPRLMKHLNRAGIHFQPAGELTEYHGLRQPFVLNKADLMQTIKPLFRPFFHQIDCFIRREMMDIDTLARHIA